MIRKLILIILVVTLITPQPPASTGRLRLYGAVGSESRPGGPAYALRPVAAENTTRDLPGIKPRIKVAQPGLCEGIFNHLFLMCAWTGGPLTGQEIADNFSLAYNTVRCYLSALSRLHLFEEPIKGKGKDAEYFIPVGVRTKAKQISYVLAQFRGENRRPDKALIGKVYETEIRPILEGKPSAIRRNKKGVIIPNPYSPQLTKKLRKLQHSLKQVIDIINESVDVPIDVYLVASFAGAELVEDSDLDLKLAPITRETTYRDYPQELKMQLEKMEVKLDKRIESLPEHIDFAYPPFYEPYVKIDMLQLEKDDDYLLKLYHQVCRSAGMFPAPKPLKDTELVLTALDAINSAA